MRFCCQGPPGLQNTLGQKSLRPFKTIAASKSRDVRGRQNVCVFWPRSTRPPKTLGQKPLRPPKMIEASKSRINGFHLQAGGPGAHKMSRRQPRRLVWAYLDCGRESKYHMYVRPPAGGLPPLRPPDLTMLGASPHPPSSVAGGFSPPLKSILSRP